MALQVTVNPVLPQPAFQGQPSFVQRLIEISVTLSQNPQNNQPTTFSDGSDTVTISGARTTVQIENNGAPGGSTANIAIYGLSQTLMNQLTTLGPVFNSIQRNTVLVKAGDPTSGLSAVFTGTISWSYGDYSSASDVPLRMSCQSGTFESVVPTSVSSYPGPVDVATIMSGFARAMNVGFENNGITSKLPPSYFSGNLWTQLKTVAEHAHIKAELVDGGTILAIYPIGGSRNTANPPLISATTGMIGYPSFTQQGLIVRMIYNPQVAFGGTIQVQSSLPQANKTWVVQKLDLNLESMKPHGNWMATAHCYAKGFPAPPSAPPPS